MKYDGPHWKQEYAWRPSVYKVSFPHPWQILASFGDLECWAGTVTDLDKLVTRHGLQGTQGGQAIQFGASRDSETAADTAMLSGGGYSTGAATFLFIQVPCLGVALAHAVQSCRILQVRQHLLLMLASIV